jgi:16S rRNA (cytosine967-C5)-methyltransferase
MRSRAAPDAPTGNFLTPGALGFALAHAARTVAAVIAGRSLNESLDRVWRELAPISAADRGAIQDLSYSTLRDFGRGDFLLHRLLRKPVEEPRIHALLLIVLMRLETRPDLAHTSVNQAVEAAKTIAGGRYQALVNAVARSFARDPERLVAAAGKDEVARWRHPSWWLERLRRDHPPHWRAIAEQGNRRPPMALRVNRRRISRTDYLALLAAAGLAGRATGENAIVLEQPVAIERLPGFTTGLVSVQDLAAQQAAILLDARDGMRVLDACAAPGGKAAHILESADVELLALDVDPHRLANAGENLDRLGLRARMVAGDCRALDAWWDGRPFDRILLDVPCSASGVVRRHPDVKWLRREGDIARYASTQREMLEALWPALAPDGKMLYATCSLFAEENRRQIADFSARRDVRLRPMSAGGPFRQLIPSAEHDGFFYASLEKRA